MTTTMTNPRAGQTNSQDRPVSHAQATKPAALGLGWRLWAAALLSLSLHAVVYLALLATLRRVFAANPGLELLVTLIIAASALLMTVLAAQQMSQRALRQIATSMRREVSELRSANQRARSLQTMASTLRATLSFERVVEAALDVCSLTIEEMGIPARSIVGAVFLFDGEELLPIAHRYFDEIDIGRRLSGQEGIVADALEQAEPLVTHKPQDDPELVRFHTLRRAATAVCIPLRAGYQIFGAILLGLNETVDLGDEHLELFNSVADQAVIALQNAQLYQQLEAEKDRIVEAEEETRKKLARDLHDGPTQSVATIAMRINFIRALMLRDPRQALTELQKVEDLAKRTSKEIRGMLFTLRPLVLETQGLAAAIETTMGRIHESDGIVMKLIGGEHAELVDDRAQGVIFYIVEEALGNARKHSQATQVEVHFWQEGDLFVTRIVDNGVGFDTRKVIEGYSKRGSLGMVNMRERADLIDGSLKLESAPGRGTAITLVVPLSKNGRHTDAGNGRVNGNQP